MSEQYFFSVIAFVVFLILAIGIRLVERTWNSPSVIFAFLWLAIVGLSLASAPEYYFSPGAIFFIASMTALFFGGGWLYDKYFLKNRQVDSKKLSLKNHEGLLIRLVGVSILSGFIAVVFLLRDCSLTINGFSKEKFLQIAEQFTRERYSGIRLSQLTMFFLMINYFGCLVAGHLVLKALNNYRKIICLLIFAPLLLFTFIYTARAILLYGLFLFIGAFIASYKKGDVGFNKHQKKIILGSVILLALILPFIFLITQAARMGVEKLSLGNVTRLFDYLKVWFAGNISAFSIWYDTFQNQVITKGQFTFGGIFELLNISRREVGIYSVSYDVDGHMAFTNIYTVFRFLLDDFGIWGACLFLFILGLLSKRLYLNSTNGNLTSTGILSGILAFLLFSFISSVWAYNTVLFAWVLFIVICFSIENIFLNAE